MSPHALPKPPIAARFPRVSGDEPGVEGYDQLAEAFSPRERG